MSFFSNLSALFDNQTGKQSLKKKPSRLPVPPKKPHRVGPARKKQPAKGKVAPARHLSTSQVGIDPVRSQAATDSIMREARAKAREIIVESKDEALAIRSGAEKKARQQEQKLSEQQQSLQSQLDKIDTRLERQTQKEEELDEQRQELTKFKEQLEDNRTKLLSKLEQISGMSKDQATQVLLEGLEKKLRHQMARMIEQKEEEAKQEADSKAKETLIEAMRLGATDFVAEYTVSVVSIPSEEIKGKIIGKSGRNIHTFERVTGVDVDLDSSPTEVKLSCFDPVRREIAKVALERLIKDGRIQPVRIEEVVEKVKKEIDKIMFEAGKKLCREVGVYNIPHGLTMILGRFKYRFSYGQNMITHTLEETKIGVKLASELGLDTNVVRLGCLLHDVGKVSENPDENHVQAGVKIAKRFSMPQAVVDCIAQHHEDEPFSGPEQVIVYIADAISGARPGARYENFEEYAERLENLEKIANAYSEVKTSYAIQAGRELRVILLPEQSKEDDVTTLAVKIKEEIEENLTFPGNVKVTVIREVRANEIAK